MHSLIPSPCLSEDIPNRYHLTLTTKSWKNGGGSLVAGVTHHVGAKCLLIAHNNLTTRGGDGEPEATAVLSLAIHEANGHVCVSGDRENIVGASSNVVRLVVAGPSISILVCPTGESLGAGPQEDSIIGIWDADAVLASLAGIEIGVVVEGKVVQLEFGARVINRTDFVVVVLAVEAADVARGTNVERPDGFVGVRVKGRVCGVRVASRVVVVGPVKTQVVARRGRRAGLWTGGRTWCCSDSLCVRDGVCHDISSCVGNSCGLRDSRACGSRRRVMTRDQVAAPKVNSVSSGSIEQS